MIRVKVSDQLIELLCQEWTEASTVRVIKGVPPGAKARGARWDAEARCLVLLFEEPCGLMEEVSDVTVVADKVTRPQGWDSAVLGRDTCPKLRQGEGGSDLWRDTSPDPTVGLLRATAGLREGV
jgi:hypothetical protein